MEMISVNSELPHIRWACYAIAFAGALATAVFVIAVGAILRDTMNSIKPHFPFPLAFPFLAVIYFFGVTLQAVRASRLVSKQHELSRTLRYLSQSIIALAVPLGLLIAWFIWTLFSLEVH
jgi:hypothetical protein